MSETIPTPLTPAWKIVRSLACECEAPAGTPCQGPPVEGDHLERWLRALTAGKITTDDFRQGIDAAASTPARWTVIPDRSAR
jgi:hypothetical protein